MPVPIATDVIRDGLRARTEVTGMLRSGMQVSTSSMDTSGSRRRLKTMVVRGCGPDVYILVTRTYFPCKYLMFM